jgi:hypothetical protein
VNLSSDGLIDLGSDGPLCPRVGSDPFDPAHALAVRFADAVYDATPRDDDGEPATPDLKKVNHAVSYSYQTSERMRLYRQTAVALDRTGTVAVEALYFMCGICGLILPAGRVPNVRG